MTQRSRRIPAASVFLEWASGPRRDRNRRTTMSIMEVELEPVPLPLAIRVRLAGPRDCDELCDLLDDPA